MRLLRVGTPAGLEQGVWQVGFVAFLWIVALYGTESYAAYGIGVSPGGFAPVAGWARSADCVEDAPAAPASRRPARSSGAARIGGPYASWPSEEEAPRDLPRLSASGT